MLTLRSSQCSVARRAARAPSAAKPRAVFITRSSPKEVEALLEKAIVDAQACDVLKKNCAPEWDAVEELAAAKSHMKDAAKADPSLSDPLEQFCKEAPDADECRVYED